MTDRQEELASAITAVDCASLEYEEWLNVGMALHAEGLDCSDWDAWSRTDSDRYHPGECEIKWMGFEDTGGVTGDTVFKLAYEAGWKPPRPERCGIRTYTFGDTVMFKGRSKAIDSAFLEAEPVKGLGLKPEEQLRCYLEELFDPDEYVGFVCSSYEKNGKRVPSSSGVYTKTAGQLIEALASGTMRDAVGDYDPEAGAWIRFNPFNGRGIRNDDVTDYRYTLIESDSNDLETQYAIIKELGLPCAAVVKSGDKSIHAIVRVDARDFAQYKDRVKFLHDKCREAGLDVDTQNKNPSRLSRMPGAMRGGKEQSLVAVNAGAASWDEWCDIREQLDDGLPAIECAGASISDLPPLAAPLIEGMLRKGHKMLLAGPSKAGKSFALIELCLAIASGGAWMGMSCAKGRVLYINMELDRASCLHRFDDVRKATLTDALAMDNVDVWNLRGKTVPLDKLAPKVIRRAAKKGYIAVVIDPIYKVLTGDENNARDMAMFVNQFDRICADLGCAVIYCHHHSKGAQGWKATADRASGSGVFARDADALLDMLELDLDGKDAKECLDGTHEGMTAWRIESTLREFRPINPANVWFDYPTHRPDETGILSLCSPREEQAPHTKGGRATKRRAEDSNAIKVAKVESTCEELYGEADEKPFKLADLVRKIGWGNDTVKRHLDASERWNRVQLNGNTAIVQKAGEF